MRKMLLMSFLMTFTILLGVTLAFDGRVKYDEAEQAAIEERLKAELERREALKTLTLPYQVPGGMILSQPRGPVGDIPSILVDCPPGGYPEGEPDCYFNYDDVYNSGCNADSTPYPFVNVSAGDTICGRSGVFEHINPDDPNDTLTYRDTDWYRVVVTVPSELTWAGTADFSYQILLIDAGSEDCVDYEILTSDVAAAGDTASITITTWPGVFWLWAGPSDWFVDLLCDGTGSIGNEYVAWVEVEPTPPCHTNTAIGDINTAVPFADMGNTTCGAGNDYSGPPSCINPYYYVTGEDYVYEFTVSEPIVLDIILDPDTTTWTSIILDDFCPPDPIIGGCIATSGGGNIPMPHGFEQILLQPGTYYVYVDKWAPTPCIESYDLYIVEGVQTLGLAETGNIPDCGVSNFGPLGETDGQGNTYGWNGNPASNFAGTLVMGNSPDTMFAFYNPGVTDCYEYRGVTGLDMVDPFHPTSRYDDNNVLGGVSIEYAGFGYSTGGAADDIFVHGFKITNNRGSSLSDYYVGVYFDWDIDTDGGDTVRFDWANNVIIQSPIADTIFYGLCLANAEAVNLNSMTAVSQNDHIYPTGPSGGGWVMSELYTLMSTPGDSIADSMFVDMSSLLSTGPHTIADGDSISVLIAVLGGASLADVQNRAAIADTLTIPDFTVDPPPPPVGRCCYVDASDTLCVNTLEDDCITLGGYDWNRYLNCDDHPCVVTGCPYVVGDVNGSGSYNGLDITYGVAFFKGGSEPMCPQCPIVECNAWHYCGDVNGSCSYNGLDITYGVAYFKGGSAPVYCAGCPPTE
ncbi:MAG: hypothetical protein JSW64_04420 [Candidatus Zixiibacteriota bacterium]|nr:MAG: hypothetical protein JSW64_04420 [candidate division Zixibacteria bacterium]